MRPSSRAVGQASDFFFFFNFFFYLKNFDFPPPNTLPPPLRHQISFLNPCFYPPSSPCILWALNGLKLSLSAKLASNWKRSVSWVLRIKVCATTLSHLCALLCGLVPTGKKNMPSLVFCDSYMDSRLEILDVTRVKRFMCEGTDGPTLQVFYPCK